jgi:biotin transport system substrate-specific component
LSIASNNVQIKDKTKTVRTDSRLGVFISLFAALICVSSFWTTPLIPGLPIVLKDLIIVLAGALLGTWRGAATTALFLLAGMLGLPVFANAGGIAAFLSPAGGYMIGYVVGALVTGFIAGKPSIMDKKPTVMYSIRIVAALFIGFMVILLCGSFWLMYLNGKSAEPKAVLGVFWGGIVPFMPGTGVKFMLSIPLTFTLRPIAARYINPKA